jgi:hypothetical protein
MRVSYTFPFLCVLLTAAAGPLAAELTATIQPSVPSPAPVGTTITLEPHVTGAAEGSRLWYRYRERAPGGRFRVIRDYGPVASLNWTAAEREGMYTVELSVRNLDTGEIVDSASDYQFESRVLAGQPTVSATSHPLVYLYSAPACPAGDRMRVQFTTGGTCRWRHPPKHELEGVRRRYVHELLPGRLTGTDGV